MGGLAILLEGPLLILLDGYAIAALLAPRKFLKIEASQLIPSQNLPKTNIVFCLIGLAVLGLLAWWHSFR